MDYDQTTILNFLEEGWKLVPDKSFWEFMSLVSEGNDISHVSDSQMVQLLKDFVLQNE